MKYLFFILPVFIFIGCGSNTSSEKKPIGAIKRRTKPHEAKPMVPDSINYNVVNVSIRDQIKALDSIYGKTPFYATVQNRNLYVVMKGKFKDYSEQFTGDAHYGIANDSLTLILPCEYDKILR